MWSDLLVPLVSCFICLAVGFIAALYVTDWRKKLTPEYPIHEIYRFLCAMQSDPGVPAQTRSAAARVLAKMAHVEALREHR